MGSRREEDHVVLGEKTEEHASLAELREDHAIWGEKREDHSILECSFLPCGLGSRRDCREEKGRKDSCW